MRVTPCVGVWIEMVGVQLYNARAKMSLPVWECGLKL